MTVGPPESQQDKGSSGDSRKGKAMLLVSMRLTCGSVCPYLWPTEQC